MNISESLIESVLESLTAALTATRGENISLKDEIADLKWAQSEVSYLRDELTASLRENERLTTLLESAKVDLRNLRAGQFQREFDELAKTSDFLDIFPHENIIPAIKYVREAIPDIGLKEAKDLVDAWRKENI